MKIANRNATWQIVPYEGKTAFKRVRVRDDGRIRDVVRHLQAHECVALIGAPFSEKSRLLNDLGDALAASGRYQPLYLDLWQANSQDEGIFFTSLARVMETELAAQGIRGPAPRGLLPNEHAFQSYLASAVDVLPGHLVLLIDHLQALPNDLVHSLLLALRAAYMEHAVNAPRQLAAVVTGGVNLVGLSTGPTSPFNIARPIVAQPLTEEQSLALAEATVAAQGAATSMAALEELVTWAGGDRHSLPLLATRTVDLARQHGRSRIDRRLVDRAAEQMFLSDPGGGPAPVREAIRTIEEDPDTILDVLRLLEQGTLTRSHARQMPTRTGVDRLQLSGAVVLVDGCYHIKNRGFETALARYFTTERVGHILRIAGRWQEAIAYLAPQLETDRGSTAQAQLLEATVQSIYATDSLPRAWELLARGLQQGFGLASCAIYRAIPSQARLELVQTLGEEQNVPASIGLDAAESVEARTFAYGSYALRGTAGEARLVVALRETTGGRRLGVVTVDRYVQNRNPHELPTQLPDLLHFLEHAAGAIENVMIRSAYREIGQAVLASGALQSTLDRVLDVVAEALGCDAAHLYLLSAARRPAAAAEVEPDLAGGVLDISAGVGQLWSPEYQALACCEEASDHPAAASLREGRMRVVPGSDPRLSRALAARFPLHKYSWVFLPLQAAGQPLGVLELGYAEAYRLLPSEESWADLGAFANQVAIAVHNMQLLRRTDEALARRVDELEKLRRSSLAISGTLDAPAVLARIVRDLHALFPDTETTIWGYNAELNTLAPLQSSLTDGAYLAATLAATSVTGQAVKTGQVQMAEDLAGLPESAGHVAAVRLGLRTLIAVPLISHDRILGAINLYSYSENSDTLDASAAELLEAFAAHAAVAIENARLHEEEIQRQRLEQELAVAQAIQRSLLPTCCPQFPGWQAAAAYRSARVVGGDFYDFCELRGEPARLGIMIADVTDKGIPAALFMALSRTIIRTMAFSGRGPASVLTRSNALIMNDSRSDVFLTAVYAVLEVGSGRLIYANAGHNRPLLYRAATKRVEELTAKGILLGAFEGIHLDEERVDIQPGDVLLFYTDGINEAANERDEMFGDERLAALLAEQAENSVEDIVDAIQVAVSDFAGAAEQTDDITCVVLKRAPVPSY